MKKQRKSLYLNLKQTIFLNNPAPKRLLLGGRGSSKTFSIGISSLDKAIRMPRSKGAIVSSTFYQLHSKTMSSIKKAWASLGYIENVHYVVKRQPKKGWKTAHIPPDDYKHCISFYWGSCIELVSMQIPDNARGGSYDWYEIDEAALLEKEDYDTILIPALRGNKEYFYGIVGWQQISLYTSIPRKPKGYWVFEIEEKAKALPHKYCFVEMNAYDNIHVLGIEGIERMKEEMDFFEFEVEVMNKRIKKAKTPFYPKFDPDKQSYLPRIGDTGEDLDVNKDELLEISVDFGGNFNCMTIWQGKKKVERCIGELYVKGEDMLKELCNRFNDKHKEHKHKVVNVWGEPRGHDRRSDGKTLYDTIDRYLTELGWYVTIKTPRGRTPKHENRRESINEMFEHTSIGKSRGDLPFVFFNELEATYTITTLQTTESNPDGTKNKSAEKNASVEQETATHLTDTVDYYLYFKYQSKFKKKNKKKIDETDIATM